jgi:hypothetical protein
LELIAPSPLRAEPASRRSKGGNNGSIAFEIALVSIDRIHYGKEINAVMALTLDETDVGKMKVWQPGEEPF